MLDYWRIIAPMSSEIIHIIQKCLEGNGDTWSVLVREYSKRAMSTLFLKYSGLTQDDRDDIIQNVFLRLSNGGLGAFKGTSQYEFLAYFNTILRNEALRHIAARNKRSVELSDSNASSDEDEESRIEFPDRDQNSQPDKQIEAHEMLTVIARALSDCAPVDQQVFLLKARGNKDREISAMLNIPLGTVAVKYSRIKDKLKQHYLRAQDDS
jgi:RNA polymerase sigma factor (sigma-70 family)